MIIKSIYIESRNLENTENTKIFILHPNMTTVKALVHLCSFLINFIKIECILFAFTILKDRSVHKTDEIFILIEFITW